MTEFGFIGGGRMATAIRDGLLQQVGENSIKVFDPHLSDESSWKSFSVDSLGELLTNCRVVFLAVKPQVFKEKKVEWSKLSTKAEVVVSVMAGISLDEIASVFSQSELIRTMPNTPMMLSSGMLALCKSENSGDKTLHLVAKLFSPIAKTLIVDEKQMDAVTAVSGSGPAYFFYLTEHLVNHSKELGLEPKAVQFLWAQTMKGAAEMLLQDGADPGILREQVTSPGGTTQAALESFSHSNLGEIFFSGVKQARDRSVELGK